MIFTDSRYASGILAKALDARSQRVKVGVYRAFPTRSARFYYYTWTERDRIDLVADELLGDPSLWWSIMDFNPEILNPYDIAVGTLVRIPGV